MWRRGGIGVVGGGGGAVDAQDGGAEVCEEEAGEGAWEGVLLVRWYMVGCFGVLTWC